jgi:hypothetical protein
MAELSRVFALSGHNPWSRPRPRLSGDEMKSVKTQMMTAAREGRVYDIIQLSFKILSTDHSNNDLIIYLRRRLYRAFANFGRLSNGAQSNSVVALRQAFAVACYRGQLDDVRRLLESIDVDGVVRDKVHMLGVGLHFTLLQKGRRSREHWDIIKWLMDNTILRDNSLVLKWATIKACNCENNELEEVRWMLQYRELAQHTETIDHALHDARSRSLALVKCLVEHADVDFNRGRQACRYTAA